MRLLSLSRLPILVVLLLFGAGAFTNTFAQQPNLKRLGNYETGAEVDEGAAEIAAFDSNTNQLFFVNADANEVVALDISDPANPTKAYTISVNNQVTRGSANSVDVHDGTVAVAVEADAVDAKGAAVFYNASNGSFIDDVNVGVLPDKLTFAQNGQVVLTANEGEPSDDYTKDPKGTVSVIDLSGGVEDASEATADFTGYNGQKSDLQSRGVRIFGGAAELPGISSVADADPAEITFDSDVSGDIEIGEWITVASNEDPIPYRVMAFSNGGQTVTLHDDFDDDTEYETASDDLTAYRKDGSSTVAQDLEPEFVTTDGSTAYVTLQENNAVATVDFSDVSNPSVEEIQALGFKDHSTPGNGLDASSDDDRINIDMYPLKGIYQPDAISSVEVNGTTYLLTANEGDTREYDAFVEEVDSEDLPFDPSLSYLQDDDKIGELITSTAPGAAGIGDTEGDGDVDQPFSFGGRSFSIWNPANFDGGGDPLVYDSGDFFEQQTARALPDNFNTDNDEKGFEKRSEDKGPEPEAVETATVNNTPYAFVGLERVGGIMIFDLSDPADPEFIEYRNDRDFSLPIKDVSADERQDNLGPESLVFIPASENANSDTNLLAVSNEVSGTVAFYAFDPKASVERTFAGMGQPQNYRLVALPGVQERSIADVVSGTTGTDWQAYYDDGSAENFLKPYDGSQAFTFEKGGGFWLTAKSPWIFDDPVATVQFPKGTSVEIPLRKGWNVISNPTDKDVRWQQIQKANGITQPLWAFDGAFKQAKTFASATKGEAYYFFNGFDVQSRDQLTIPYPSYPSKAAKATEDGAASLLAITATSSGSEESRLQSTVRIGLQKKAKPGIGAEDVVAPPSRFEAVSLRLKPSGSTESKRSRYLKTEQRPPTDAAGQTFDVQLTSTSEEPVQVSWRTLSAVNGKEVVLLNPTTGTSHDLRSKSSITVEPDGQTTSLKVAVGTQDFVEDRIENIAPGETSLRAYPNPISQKGTFEYTLPDGDDVSLRLYDVLGRVVKVLDSGTKEAGRHVVRFQAEQLASGVYFGRLTTGGQTHTEKVTVVR